MTVQDYDKKPHHHLPPCPKCAEDGMNGQPTPLEAWEGDKIARGTAKANQLCCAACGAHWTEDDPEKLAAAWFGYGAYEALREAGVM